MTVLDFIRAHFSLDSQVDNLLVRRNTDGFCETLYSGAIDDERYMKPEVKCATIRKWCLPGVGVPLSLLSSKGSGLMRVCWNRQTGKLEVLVPIRACEFKSHYPHHGALLTNMTGARLPANGFPIESTPVMTK